MSLKLEERRFAPGSWKTSYELRATSYELRATSYELRATSYELRATSYEPGLCLRRARGLPLQQRFEEVAGVRGGVGRDLLRCAFGDDLPAA